MSDDWKRICDLQPPRLFESKQDVRRSVHGSWLSSLNVRLVGWFDVTLDGLLLYTNARSPYIDYDHGTNASTLRRSLGAPWQAAVTSSSLLSPHDTSNATLSTRHCQPPPAQYLGRQLGRERRALERHAQRRQHRRHRRRRRGREAAASAGLQRERAKLGQLGRRQTRVVRDLRRCQLGRL